MLYNGIFGCYGNICYIILINAFFCNVHIIGPINVCTNFEISRYNIDEFRKHAKIYVLFEVMWRKNGTSYVRTAPIVPIGIFISNILKPTRSLYDFRFKSYGSNSGFNIVDDLDIWPIFYWLSHKVGMQYWNLLVNIHKNPSRINWWYGHS